MRTRLVASLLALVLVAASPIATAAPLGAPAKLAGGIRLWELETETTNPQRVWIYGPARQRDDVPLVLIAPTGTNPLVAAELNLDDRAEHLAYAKAGFAVVAYGLDGASGFCVESARGALDLALGNFEHIDVERVFTAGRGSGGTVALVVAAHIPEIRAAVALEPITHVEKSMAAEVETMDAATDGYRAALRRHDPANLVDRLDRPLFLHASREAAEAHAAQRDFRLAIEARHPGRVTYIETGISDSEEDRVDSGLSEAISWMERQRHSDRLVQREYNLRDARRLAHGQVAGKRARIAQELGIIREREARIDEERSRPSPYGPRIAQLERQRASAEQRLRDAEAALEVAEAEVESAERALAAMGIALR